MSKLSDKIRRAQKGRAAAKALKERHPDLDVITPAVPRITAREIAEDILHPVRRNDMKARRKKLRLSQSELATVFDVDVVSIYRRERDKVLPILWDYALKGVEAEAANPGAQQILRAFRSDLDRTNVIVPGGLRHGATAWWRYGWSARCAIASALTALRKRFSAPNARLTKPSWSICQSRDPRAVRPANTFWAVSTQETHRSDGQGPCTMADCGSPARFFLRRGR